MQQTVTDVLVEEIRREIIRGNFAPGQHLRLRDLAEQYNVSTTPIREALRELETEGILTGAPRKGSFVTQLTIEDIKDIYDIRSNLEAMATRLAVPQLTQGDIDTLQAIVEEMENNLGRVAKLVNLNHDFHMTLYEAAHRRHLLDLLRQLRFRTQHYLHAYMIDLGRMPIAQKEHRSIILASKDGNAAEASQLVFDHVSEAGEGIIEYLTKNPP